MNTSKKTFYALLIVFLLSGVSGLFGAYLLKNYTPESIHTNSPEALIPGFQKTQGKTIPADIPQGMVVEDPQNIIDSFTIKTRTETQSTFKYVSEEVYTNNFVSFNTFLYSKGWNRVTEIKNGVPMNLTYTLGTTQTLYISFSDIQNVGHIVDITLVKNN